MPAGPLKADIHAEIAIIGAGFAGLATALGLVERGRHDIAILEAQQVGHGASGRNGGFVFGGYSLGETQLVRQQGPARAREMYRLTLDAVQLIKHRCRHYRINCDLNSAGIVLADWFGDRRRMRQKQDFMNRVLGCRWEWLNQPELRGRIRSARYHGGLLEPDAAHFHPLKYARGIASRLASSGVRLFQDSPALNITGRQGAFRITTPNGSVSAEQVVIAGGGYLHGLEARTSRAILPIATYVMVTEPLGSRLTEFLNCEHAVYDTRFAFDYYRPLPDTRVLWGGRISVRDPGPAVIEKWLRRDLARVFPELAGVAVDHVWSGLMGYPLHKMPIVHPLQPGLWTCIGFGGHGVAPTTAIGELTAAAIADGDQRYRWFDDYRLPPAWSGLGRAGAQISYWGLQTLDWFRDRRRFQ